ncbi:MAG: tRNA-guanine transglycosylase, partial [Planctomycetota bacterium]
PRSAAGTIAPDLPGYAIGGLSVGESFDDRNRVLSCTCPLLPAERPRYLMGVGTPLDLVAAIDRGCDQFDCVLPTRMGRHGIAYSDHGPLHLKRADYARDPRPIDADTPSPADRVSRGYIRHLLKAGEHLGGQLVGLHNLAYYQRLMGRCQAAIRAGSWATFAADFAQRYDARSGDAAAIGT